MGSEMLKHDMNTLDNYEKSLKEQLQNNVYLTEQQQEEIKRQREKYNQMQNLAMGDLNQSHDEVQETERKSYNEEQYFDSVSNHEVGKGGHNCDDTMNTNAMREYAVIEEREMKLKNKELANDVVCAKMQEVNDARTEKMKNKSMLEEKDYMEKRAKEEDNEKVRAGIARKDMKNALDEQIEDKKRGKKLEREREAAMQVVSNKLHQDVHDRELERERIVREKNRQYSEDLKKQIEENRLRKENDKKKLVEEQAGTTTWDYMKKWDSKEQKYINKP